MKLKRGLMGVILIGIFLISLNFVSASRLPTVGGDNSTWGTILNDFLSRIAGANATELNLTMVNGTNIYPFSINTTHIIDGTITDEDISNTTNLTIGEKITFSFGEIIDNLINGWVRITGNLDVTGDSKVSGNMNITGNTHIEGNVSFMRPHGTFSSTETQVMAAASTAYPVTFNWTENSYEITKSSDNANFSFGQTGEYLIELSAIVDTDLNNKIIEIWVQKNGVDVPRSNTRVKIPSAATETLIVVPYIIEMNLTDEFRVMMGTDDAGSMLLAIAATAYSPASPSIIMVISKISEITD